MLQILSVINYLICLNFNEIYVKKGEITFYQSFTKLTSADSNPKTDIVRTNVDSSIEVIKESSSSKKTFELIEGDSIDLNVGGDQIYFYIKKTDEISKLLNDFTLDHMSDGYDPSSEYIRFRISYAKLTILLSNGYFKLVNLKFSDDTKIEFEGTENNYTPFKDESLIKGRRIYIVDPNQVVKNNLFEEKQSRTIVDQDRLSEEYFASFKDNQIRQFQ